MPDVADLLNRHGPLLVLLLVLAARLGLPVPAAPVLVVTGGMLVAPAAGSMALGWGGVFAASLLANLAGDAAWFYAGRWRGHRILRLLCRISISPDSCVRQSESLVVRWGGWSLIGAKFLPGVSVVAAPMAGALGMPLARFLVFDSVGALLWTFAFVGLGVVFSDQVQLVLDGLEHAGLLAGAVLLAAAIGWLLWRIGRRVAARRGPKLPDIDAAELHRVVSSAGTTRVVVVDVRSTAGRTLDPRRIASAHGLGLAELRAGAADTLPSGDKVVVYCDCPNDVSAREAARLLERAGRRNVHVLAGGLDAWSAAGYPLERHGA